MHLQASFAGLNTYLGKLEKELKHSVGTSVLRSCLGLIDQCKRFSRAAPVLLQTIRRMFYLALPPSVFEPVTAHIRNKVWSSGINRVIIEKPFGRDSASSEVLSTVCDSLSSLGLPAILFCGPLQCFVVTMLTLVIHVTSLYRAASFGPLPRKGSLSYRPLPWEGDGAELDGRSVS
jgi:hypothetical protein